MTGQIYQGLLRQLSTEHTIELLPLYVLSEYQEIVVGRDPSCEIALDPNYFIIVSRRHAAIRPLQALGNNLPSWEICDLNSANGTFINGQYLQGCRQLQTGDRIELGKNGPLFSFECQLNHTTPLYSPPPPPPQANATPLRSTVPVGTESDVTFTQLFPLASTGKNLTQKAFLIPGMLTVVFVVLMFAAVGQPIVFNMLLAAYLAGTAFYFVYRLCGKFKPWWVLVSCTIATALILVSPILPLFITIFREILPGNLPSEGEEINFISLLVRMFFGAGLMEELLKALPVLLLCFIGTFLPSPWREKVGVWEPLDGILLGAASAIGFTLLETLGQYVPDIINNTPLQAGDGQLLGLQLLIARVLGSVVGHMAYSGYFGYFIGLSVIRPKKRWQILCIGYFSASVLHALWNSTGFVTPILLALVGVLSYALLASAILKARVLSPTRAQNFATRLLGD
ncbi:MAG: PrsW family glutamic-type intramembrane protease [Coleofasciculaceae cyanobacterium]